MIAEVLLYTRTLTAREDFKQKCYLAWRWFPPTEARRMRRTAWFRMLKGLAREFVASWR